jgi:predicted phage terminase large subunit-like protein
MIDLVDDWAEPVAVVRYWDLAATEPHEGNKDPDYTTGTRLELGTDGYTTITDVKHVRLGPGAVERFVQDVAIADGYHVRVYIEQDPGQAGKAQVHNYARMMPGVQVKPGLTKNMDKRTRSQPAAGAFENRVLRINRYLTNLQTVLLELRRFPNEGAHDDIVDTISGGYTSLTQGGFQSVTSVSSVATQGTTGGDAVEGPADLPRSPASVVEMMRRDRR